MKEKNPWIRLVFGLLVIVVCVLLIIRMAGLARRLLAGGVEALNGLFSGIVQEETDRPDPEEDQQILRELFGEDSYNGDMVAAPEQ